MCDYDYAPSEAVCPRCGSLSRRHYKALRKIRDICLDAPTAIEVKVGVYRCKVCNRQFRFQPDFADKGRHYTKRAVNEIYASIQSDKSTFVGTAKRAKRSLNINPSTSSCHRWFHRKAGNIDLTKEYEPWVVSAFSGVLAIDEVFDGGKCTFFATDPLNNRTIAFHRSDYSDGEELKTFLGRLKAMGINPEVLISDGAPIYENILKRYGRILSTNYAPSISLGTA